MDQGPPATANLQDLGEVGLTRPVWFRVLSYYFGIEANDSRLVEYVESVIGMFNVDRDPAEEPNPPTPGYPVRYRFVDLGKADEARYRLYHNDSIMAASADPGYVLDQFFWHVNAQCARHSGDFVLIHSAAVAADGAGILIPGASGTGKSTLVVGLVRDGFEYYSDEAAAIDPVSGRLHPYPKAITLKDRVVFDVYPDVQPVRVDDQFRPNRWYVVPTPQASSRAVSSCPIKYVFHSRFVPGAVTTCSAITSAAAAYTLGRNVMNIGRYGARVLPLLSDLVRDAQCFSLESGNLREAVAAVREAVDRSA